MLYFNAPKNFNDPYDCRILPDIKTPTDEDVESIRGQYLSEFEVGSPIREQAKTASIDRLREMFINSAKNIAAQKVKEFSETRGVSCFSEKCDDLLMWAHYGDNYRGFCLEFDTSHFEKLQKVTYSNDLPMFDPVPILSHQFEASDFMSMFTSKSSSWAYEKEWRFFHAAAGTLYYYPPEALTGVYFGPEIRRVALEIVCLILKGQNETVTFWEGKKGGTQFKVDFEQFIWPIENNNSNQ